MTILLVDQIAALALAVADRGYCWNPDTSCAADTAAALVPIPKWKPLISAAKQRNSRPQMPSILFCACRIAGSEETSVDIGIKEGRIAAIEMQLPDTAPSENVDGRLVLPGFVETHIHLDKSCILDRCRTETGSLDEAIAAVAKAKRAFSEDDVYTRAQRTLEKAILHGTTRMRTHVEIDPRIGLRSFNAIKN